MYNIKDDLITIINLMDKKYIDKIPLNVIISSLKDIYPIGKTSLKTKISFVLKLDFNTNQKYIQKKYYKKFIVKESLDEINFSIVEALYFLYKNNIKSIDKKKLYQFLVYNYQLDNVSLNCFYNHLVELNLYRKNIKITKKILDNIVVNNNVNCAKLYNDTYIIKEL